MARANFEIKLYIMSIISKLKQIIYSRQINKNDASKRVWLRSLGARIGEGTRFIGKPYLGSEPYLIEIGNDCLISDKVSFFTHDGGVKVLNDAGFFNGQRMDKMARIKIGSNCFIGSGARIMGGVKIGDNCIIGAASIVTRDVPNGCVVAGMPAKVICSIEEYYKKNKARGVFFPTPSLTPEEKKNYLVKHVPELD